MKLTFGQVAGFVAEWRRLRLTDEDLQALETLIMERPESGAVMPGTGGLRKIRFAPPSWHRGKSGAARVCYVLFSELDQCYFIALFPKNEQANLTAAQKVHATQIIESLKAHLRNNP